MTDRVVCATEAAKILCVSRTFFNGLVDRNEIACVAYLGKSERIKRYLVSDLEAYIRKNRTPV